MMVEGLKVDPGIADVLAKALAGEELSEEEGEFLLDGRDVDCLAVAAAADEMRRRQVGEVVTYVLNRNINFTNVCWARCSFCAFSRGGRDADAYLMSVQEVGRRAEEAWLAGCSEVCVQGGLNPEAGGDYYLELCREIRRRAPGIHVHAFSPFEVWYGARQKGWSVRDYLAALREAGLGSMPGTAAEILDDRVRQVICPAKLSVDDWVAVVEEAHRAGIPTSATMMYGHVETNRHRAKHMVLIRSIQRATGGFTEFVPLSFVHARTALFSSGRCRPGASGLEDVTVHAVARLLLGGAIRNVQASWVKLGPKLAQLCLAAGANDLGGTLVEEHISRSAGSVWGQSMTECELRRLAESMGRAPRRRSTTYGTAGPCAGPGRSADGHATR